MSNTALLYGRMFMVGDHPVVVLGASAVVGWVRCQDMVTEEIDIFHPRRLGEEMVVQELDGDRFLVRKGSRVFRLPDVTYTGADGRRYGKDGAL